ncbi:MAG: iron-siderophore ABC transporter substrate-binding protein, partial [Alphaproteobacteria bacterium]|nr:iron-siderophore ABC transporter substrate-binding protein [Alphaproteobacteria bacterium]
MRINLHHLALTTALLCLPWTISVRAADETGFPLEISHALGNTTIATRPNRVATVAWANHEV